MKQHFLPNVDKQPNSGNFKLSQKGIFMIAQYPHHLLVCRLIHVIQETKALVLEIGVQHLLAYVILEMKSRLYNFYLQYVSSCHNLLIPTYIHHAIKQCFFQLDNFEKCQSPLDIIGNGKEINQYMHDNEPLQVLHVATNCDFCYSLEVRAHLCSESLTYAHGSSRHQCIHVRLLFIRYV